MRFLIALAALTLASPLTAQTVLRDAKTGDYYSADQTREDARVLAGFGYTVSSSIVSVAANNYLNGQLTNPANSGVTYVMTNRILACNIVGGQAPSEYARYSTGATLPGTPTSVAISNRRAGGAAITGTFQFQMGTAPMTGTISSSGFIPTNGERLDLLPVVLVPPGTTLNYSIGGAGGGLAAAARCVMTLLFYTVPV
jgi:hypothetical protein